MNFPNCPPDVCGGGYIDSNCLIYHLFNQSPTKLINLGLGNGSSSQLIFETIDTYLGSLAGNAGPIDPVSTNAISFTGSGPGNRILTPTLILASGTTQIASILPTGLFVPDLRDWKVKINASDFPGYLNDKLIGGIDPSGIVSITTEVDPLGPNLVAILPDINVVALANNSVFDQALATNETFLGDLSNNSFFLNALVSPNAGNIIEALSNGLYASGGTIVGADNGLSVSGNTIQLGGALIHNTTIDFSSIEQLYFINDPVFGIGTNTPSGTATIEVQTNQSKLFGSIHNTNFTFGVETNRGGIYSSLNVVGGNQTHSTSGDFGSLYGQLWFNSTGNVTLDSTVSNGYSSILGFISKSGTGNVTGNVISAAYFSAALANSGNVDTISLLRTGGAPNVPLSFGPAFTGTVTNFYGLLLDDISSSTYGSRLTNKYAIFQTGVSDKVQFNGIVTASNAGNSIVTSDKRVKENITDFDSDLNSIEKIKLHRFNYIYDKDRPAIGVIAQELEQILPEVVETDYYKVPSGEEISDFKFVNSGKLFYVMLGAVQQLISQNKSLEFRIKNLEAQLVK